MIAEAKQSRKTRTTISYWAFKAIGMSAILDGCSSIAELEDRLTHIGYPPGSYKIFEQEITRETKGGFPVSNTFRQVF